MLNAKSWTQRACAEIINEILCFLVNKLAFFLHIQDEWGELEFILLRGREDWWYPFIAALHSSLIPFCLHCFPPLRFLLFQISAASPFPCFERLHETCVSWRSSQCSAVAGGSHLWKFLKADCSQTAFWWFMLQRRLAVAFCAAGARCYVRQYHILYTSHGFSQVLPSNCTETWGLGSERLICKQIKICTEQSKGSKAFILPSYFKP